MSNPDVAALVEYVETILAMADPAALERGKPVQVYDANQSAIWLDHHRQVVRQFRRGWRIEPDPAREAGYLFYRK